MTSLTTLRRLGWAALALGFFHVVFGAIVRITGSGLGCGNNWPDCNGALIPLFTNFTVVIEFTHRLLAAGLTITVAVLAVLSRRGRGRVGYGIRGGVFRAAAAAAVLVIAAALFGAAIVKLDLNQRSLIAVHLALAMSLLAALVIAILRAGGFASSGAAAVPVSRATMRASIAAAALAFGVLVFGALTANLPGAAVSCRGFPLCRSVEVTGTALAVHVAHRAMAVILLLHVIGLAIGIARRHEAALLRRMSRFALVAVIGQIIIAAAMVEMRLPPVLQSVHQAVGTLVWLSIFTLAALAYPWREVAFVTTRATVDAAAPLPDGAALAPLPSPPKRKPPSMAVMIARGADH